MINSIVIRGYEAFANGKYAIMTGWKESCAYKDGVPGAVDGVRINAVMPSNKFEPLSIKMPINTVLPITQEEIERRNAAGDFVFCVFEGFTAKIYENFRDHTVGISATATDIHILPAATDKEAD